MKRPTARCPHQCAAMARSCKRIFLRTQAARVRSALPRRCRAASAPSPPHEAIGALVAEVGKQTRYLVGERAVSWQSDGPLILEGNLSKGGATAVPVAGSLAGGQVAWGWDRGDK